MSNEEVSVIPPRHKQLGVLFFSNPYFCPLLFMHEKYMQIDILLKILYEIFRKK
jgi:hypothetical protein